MHAMEAWSSNDIEERVLQVLSENNTFLSINELMEEMGYFDKISLMGVLHRMCIKDQTIFRAQGLCQKKKETQKTWIYSLSEENFPTIGENFTCTVNDKKGNSTKEIFEFIGLEQVSAEVMLFNKKENNNKDLIIQEVLYIHKKKEEKEYEPLTLEEELEDDPIPESNETEEETIFEEEDGPIRGGIIAQKVLLGLIAHSSRGTPVDLIRRMQRTVVLENPQAQVGDTNKMNQIKDWRSCLSTWILDIMRKTPGKTWQAKDLKDIISKQFSASLKEVTSDALRKAISNRLYHLSDIGSIKKDGDPAVFFFGEEIIEQTIENPETKISQSLLLQIKMVKDLSKQLKDKSKIKKIFDNLDEIEYLINN